MPHPSHRRVGRTPPERHSRHRAPGGGLHHEEPTGAQGFFSYSSFLLRRSVPPAAAPAAPSQPPGHEPAADSPLVPRRSRLDDRLMPGDAERLDPVTGRLLIAVAGAQCDGPGCAWSWAGRAAAS